MTHTFVIVIYPNDNQMFYLYYSLFYWVIQIKIFIAVNFTANFTVNYTFHDNGISIK